jgi:arsenate reductase-like glutaredoxin family protein
MSCKHKATGTWRIKPNGNKSVAVGNVLLSEAFFRKYGLDREIRKLKAKGIDLSKLAELMVAYKLGLKQLHRSSLNYKKNNRTRIEVIYQVSYFLSIIIIHQIHGISRHSYFNYDTLR